MIFDCGKIPYYTTEQRAHFKYMQANYFTDPFFLDLCKIFS